MFITTWKRLMQIWPGSSTSTQLHFYWIQQSAQQRVLSQLFIFNAGYANAPRQEVKAADKAVPDPTFTLPQTLTFKAFYPVWSRCTSSDLSSTWMPRGRSTPSAAPGGVTPQGPGIRASPALPRAEMLNFTSDGIAGSAGLLPGAGHTLSALTLSWALGTASCRFGASPPPAAPPAPLPRSYLGALAGAADVVAHPGRLVHAGLQSWASAHLGEERRRGDGSRQGRTGCAAPGLSPCSGADTRLRDCHPALRLSPRSGAVTPLRDCNPALGLSPCSGIVTPVRGCHSLRECHPAPGLSPRSGAVPPLRDSAPVRRGLRAGGAPVSQTAPEPPRPRQRFPPPPSKAEARRARLCPPPALRGGRGSGEGEPGSAPLGSVRFGSAPRDAPHPRIRAPLTPSASFHRIPHSGVGSGKSR